MNRLIALSTAAGRFLGSRRLGRGLLGCAVVAPAVVLAVGHLAHATTAAPPAVRCPEDARSLDAQATPTGPTAVAGTGRDRNPPPEPHRGGDHAGREHHPHGPAAVSALPQADGRAGRAAAPPPAARSASTWPTPRPAPSGEITEDPASRPVEPSPLLGLLILLLPVAAIGLTLRRRAPAPAPAMTARVSAAPPAAAPPAPPPPRQRADGVALTPFCGLLLALGGRRAADLARLITLSALEDGSGLVVLPRADAMRLLGLEEDELLDEPPDELFLPGTLDAALSYLETELRLRARGQGSGAQPRLLLVADCGAEADRIARLFARHPGALSAVILGEWPGERTVVDTDGRISAPSHLAALLPKQAPALSRAEARHRLDALLAGSRRRSRGPRRGRRR